MLEATEPLLPWLVVLVVAFVTVASYLMSGRSKPERLVKHEDKAIPKDGKPMTLDVSPRKKASPQKKTRDKSPLPEIDPAMDVWEERRKKGISNSTNNSKETEQTNKPFGSSYYYAHNNSSAKGGYTDGLKIEDYTMNGPRLLSKGGQPVKDANSQANENLATSSMRETTTSAHKKGAHIKTRQITRYLWDDEGDDSGVAVIRIDQLPTTNPTELIDWADANVTEATANIVGDSGLLVSIKTNDSDVQYRLYIKQLYGPATAVKAVTKTKRLLIRIHKKKEKANLKPWPHPQKKA